MAKTRAPKAGGPGSITGQGTRSHVPPLRPHAAKYVFCGGASLITQLVKNLPAMQETQVQFLNWEDPLEKEMAIQSNILAWKIPWTEEPGGLQSMGLQESDMT